MEIEDLAYLLHQRHLSDSRVILELFTRDHGRVAVVWRKAKQRGGRRRARESALQPFSLVECLYFGASDLKTAKHIEPIGVPLNLSGEPLYCGLYLNEFIVRALAQDEPHLEMFELYADSIKRLSLCQQNQQLKPILRSFELRALEWLGYGIDFMADTAGREIVNSDQVYYCFSRGEGFIAALEIDDLRGVYSGSVLRSIAAEDWRDENVHQAAKRLCREAMKQILGDRPLRSRELYQQLQTSKSNKK